jgi:hypothetical protein
MRPATIAVTIAGPEPNLPKVLLYAGGGTIF